MKTNSRAISRGEQDAKCRAGDSGSKVVVVEWLFWLLTMISRDIVICAKVFLPEFITCDTQSYRRRKANLIRLIPSELNPNIPNFHPFPKHDSPCFFLWPWSSGSPQASETQHATHIELQALLALGRTFKTASSINRRSPCGASSDARLDLPTWSCQDERNSFASCESFPPVIRKESGKRGASLKQ